MSKHTPGPWISVSNGGDDSDDRKLLVGKNDKHGDFTLIADCRSRFVAEEIGGDEEANARLIAAAPDLLAVAKAFMNMDRPRPTIAELNKVLDMASKAIAKAEGRS